MNPRVLVAAALARVLAPAAASPQALGVEHTYIEVPGGLHGDVVAPHMAAIIEFFGRHREIAKPTSQPE